MNIVYQLTLNTNLMTVCLSEKQQSPALNKSHGMGSVEDLCTRLTQCSVLGGIRGNTTTLRGFFLLSIRVCFDINSLIKH